MTTHLARTVARLATALLVIAAAAPAQTEQTLVQIAQTGIGSNGFGTSWRGQDIELTEDAWVTRVVWKTGSATANVDEIRLMSAIPNPINLRVETKITKTSTEASATFSKPFMMRGGTRYTLWFHQTGSARGTYGCNLTLIDPTWKAYHTNVDPSQAPGAGEPGYFWGYKYATNLSLFGHDNLEVSGSLVPGGTAVITIETPPVDFAVIAFALRSADLQLQPFTGPMRLDPVSVLPASISGNVGPSGVMTTTLPIPPNTSLHGAVLYLQGLHDPNFAIGATFTPLEVLKIQ